MNEIVPPQPHTHTHKNLKKIKAKNFLGEISLQRRNFNRSEEHNSGFNGSHSTYDFNHEVGNNNSKVPPAVYFSSSWHPERNHNNTLQLKALEGHNILLRCPVRSRSVPFFCEWRKDDELIHQGWMR